MHMTMKQFADTFLESEKHSLEDEADRLEKFLEQSDERYKSQFAEAIIYLQEARNIIRGIIREINKE